MSQRPDAGPSTGGVYDENGVDLSLVRMALRQSPTERLRAWQAFEDAIRSARRVSDAPGVSPTEAPQKGDGAGVR